MSDVAARAASERASRRQSMMALGMAVVAAGATNADVTEARKKGNTCKKREKKRCSNDAAACKPLVASICQLGPAECIAAQDCCDECSADGLVTCLSGVFPT